MKTLESAETKRQDPEYLAELAEIERAQTQGDTLEDIELRQQGISELYARHYQSMYRVALHRTTEHYTAEDLVQEAFAKALPKIPSFRERGGGMGGWLRTIVIRKFNDMYKQQSRQENRLYDLSETLEAMQQLEGRYVSTSRTEDPELIAVNREYVGEVLGAILSHAPSAEKKQVTKQRLAVVSLQSLGYTGKEVAEMTGIAKGTVDSGKSRLQHEVQLLLQSSQ